MTNIEPNCQQKICHEILSVHDIKTIKNPVNMTGFFEMQIG